LRGLGGRPSEPEIAQFQRLRAHINQQVFGLDVAVDDVVRVAPVDGVDELKGVQTNDLGIQSLRLFLQHFE
jgi:hypothetical protein